MTKPQANAPIRSLPPAEWPAKDQRRWEEACRAGGRLSRGGRAAHLKQVTRKDLACRYGLFLDFLTRCGLLRADASASELITPENVAAYLQEITARVSSVSVHGAIAKLRRMGELLEPGWDAAWLRDIEQELAWEMRPAAKQGRIIDSDRIYEAGLELMRHAEEGSHIPPVRRCRLYRNGLMIALLASCPIRLKNFAAIEVEGTLRKVGEGWIIALPASHTKSGRRDERPVPETLVRKIETYLQSYRRPSTQSASLWIGRTGEPLTYAGVERIITETTRAVFGIPVSPHLFRSSAASNCYRYAPTSPGLAAAVLQHTDPSVTEKHYNRAKCVSSGMEFLNMIEGEATACAATES